MSNPFAVLGVAAMVLACGAAAAGGEEAAAAALPPDLALARYGAGPGAGVEDAVLRLLDGAAGPGQCNTAGSALGGAAPWAEVEVRFRLWIGEGTEGGAVALLHTGRFGARGPAPYLPCWESPNLETSFAVGFDGSNPHDRDRFNANGNFYDRPQREVSLHWDGRELVKRCVTAEFRGAWCAVVVRVKAVDGGFTADVLLDGAAVYDAFFVPSAASYPWRLAFGARSGAAPARFDVKDVAVSTRAAEHRPRPPLRVEVFRRVFCTAKQNTHTRTVDLPDAALAVRRIVLILELHEPQQGFDEWDRCAAVYAWRGQERFEILRFITPYLRETHWEVDVTDYQSLLRGPVKMDVFAGSNYPDRGFDVSVALAYTRGVPASEAYRVVNLWSGWAVYGSDDAPFGDFFPERTVPVEAEASGARLRLTFTGHTQIGEFTPAKRSVTFNGARFENVLWKSDCYLNPVRPQAGTWKFDRAGWAPGDVVAPWIVDVSAALKPGQDARVAYHPEAYDFGPQRGDVPPGELRLARHWVEAQLVLDRKADPARYRLDPPLLVVRVAPGSQAETIGLRAGDFIVSYDGVEVNTVAELTAVKEAAAGKAEVAMVVLRDGETLRLTLAPGAIGVNLAER